MLKTYIFNSADASKFVTARSKLYSFATICQKEFADFCLDEKYGLFIKIQGYDKEMYNKILTQTENWEIKVVRTEDWDPTIYTSGKTIKEGIQDINPKNILVKDGIFAGLIDIVDCGEHFEIHYLLLQEFIGEPLLFKSSSGFGSSDHDMMYTVNFYLQKKE